MIAVLKVKSEKDATFRLILALFRHRKNYRRGYYFNMVIWSFKRYNILGYLLFNIVKESVSGQRETVLKIRQKSEGETK